MNSRRTFVKSCAAAGALSVAETQAAAPPAPSADQGPTSPTTGRDDRAYWLSVLQRIGTPVLLRLSQRKLRKSMPVEAVADHRERSTHLEAVARTLVGLAPWLELRGLEGAEAAT